MFPKLISLVAVAVVVAGCNRKENPSAPEDGAQVIYKDAGGRVLTANDLTKKDGDYQWEVVGGKPIPAEAKRLHEQARDYGSKGELNKAAELLEAAAKLAPDWPYPSYDLAYTYSLMGKYSDALALYEKVDRMEPRGFFTAKTALWALQKEKEGTFPAGTYLDYLKIEWAQTDNERLLLAQGILASASNYPPALKVCFLYSKDKQAKADYLNRALAAHPDPETYGILVINNALQIREDGNKAEAIRLLGELALNTNSTLGTVSMAKSALAFIVQGK